MRGLYAIADAQVCSAMGLQLLTVVEALLAARPAAIQLRAKDSSPAQCLTWLKQIRKMTPAGTLFFANDRPDLAELADCDGVHLGQEDLPAAHVRRAYPRLMLGLSTHNLLQLDEAIVQAPDYVAFGPIFATRSKLNADPSVGTAMLQLAHERTRAAGVPLVAIGGVSALTASQIAPWADLAAVISSVLTGPNDEVRTPLAITDAARVLQALLSAD
ncbi:MAG: hypothetical protein RJA70_2613 [Pseudomonadota bacterium]|jgi:thiamine-phosphate pyrophosphorylase